MSRIESDLVIAATGTNTALQLQGKGTGKVALGDANLLVPDADGAAGQIVTTDGSANLVFAATPGSSGNVLTSNGSAWTSAAAAGGGAVAWYTNIAVIEYNTDYFNGGSNGSVPNLTGGSGSWTYTIPATEIFVMVIGGGGTSHNSTQGGTTSFGSHVSATGGQGSTAAAHNSYAQAIGGIGSSGDINIRGNMGGAPSSTNVNANPNNPGPMFAGVTYGYGGGGGSTHTGWGACGGYAQKRITGLTIGNTETVTVSNWVSDGGYDNTYKSHQGGQGVCVVMY